MAKPERIYWDSCAWLGLLNGEPQKKSELELIYGFAKKGHYEIWTSTLTMVEVRRVSGETNASRPWTATNERMIQDLFRQVFVKPIPVAVDIADAARQLFRATPNLGCWQDAVHLASATRWNVETMHTYDKGDLLHLDQKLTCQNGNPLTICFPRQTTHGSLFAGSAGQ